MSARLGTLNLGLMSSYELRNFAERSAAAIAGTPGADPYLITVGTRVTGLLSEQQEILSRFPVDAHTVQLSDADDERDRAFLSLKSGIRFRETSADPAVAASARHLADIVQVHGKDLDRAPYAEESARINALIADCDTPENRAHVERTGLAPEVERLRSSNAAFVALHNSRTEINAGAAHSPALEANRSALRSQMILITNIIDSEISLGQSPWAAALADIIDEILVSVVPAAKRRRTAREKAAEEAAGSGTTPPPAPHA